MPAKQLQEIFPSHGKKEQAKGAVPVSQHVRASRVGGGGAVVVGGQGMGGVPYMPHVRLVGELGKLCDVVIRNDVEYGSCAQHAGLMTRAAGMQEKRGGVPTRMPSSIVWRHQTWWHRRVGLHRPVQPKGGQRKPQRSSLRQQILLKIMQ